MITKSQYYRAIELLKKNLIASGFTTVTFRNLSDVDLDKQNIYPLAHIVPETASMTTTTTTLRFSILGMDQVNFPKGEEPTDTEGKFYGQDNTQDILQDILAKLQQSVKLMENEVEQPLKIIYSVEFEPFTERFSNLMAGWVGSIGIQVPNLTLDKC